MKFHDCPTEAEYPMIYRLDKECIFSVWAEEGEFYLQEECDQYFSVKLSADELRKLGQELIDLANA